MEYTNEQYTLSELGNSLVIYVKMPFELKKIWYILVLLQERTGFSQKVVHSLGLQA